MKQTIFYGSLLFVAVSLLSSCIEQPIASSSDITGALNTIEETTPETETMAEETVPLSADGRTVRLGDHETMHGEDYVLTFYDDFSGTELDYSNWEYCPDWERGDAGGRWDSSQVRVEDDALKLSVSYNEEEERFFSGAVRTLGIFEQTGGYFECAMKVQDVPGFWSAFWLMSPEIGNIGNGAEDGAEIDIMEAYSVADSAINFALHWDGYGEEHQSAASQVFRPDLYDGAYHTYALRWGDDAYVFYIDGEECFRTAEGGICRVPTYMKLSLEVGSWAGTINPENLPADVCVDYVRVYQFADPD